MKFALLFLFLYSSLMGFYVLCQQLSIFDKNYLKKTPALPPRQQHCGCVAVTPGYSISDSALTVASRKDGVHHGGTAKQVDERHERVAISLVCVGLQCRLALLLHGT